MRPDVPTLREHPLFARVHESHLTKLISSKHVALHHYVRGELIHMVYEQCIWGEVVLHGVCAVEQVSEAGEIFSVAAFTDGSLIGGNLVFSSDPYYPHTIVAQQDCALIRIERSALFSLLRIDAHALQVFLQQMSDHTVLINNRLSTFVHQSLRQRLMQYLQDESVRQQSKTVILPVTKTRLAQILGASRTSISRELGKMEHEGMIMMQNRTIIVK
jgi:CRP-like cAMP-binding protein